VKNIYKPKKRFT